MYPANNCIRAALGFDEDFRNVDADEPDAEDQNSAEEPYRQHHRHPSLQKASKQQLLKQQYEADQPGQRRDRDAKIEYGNKRYLAKGRDTVNQGCPTMPRTVGRAAA